MSLPQRLWVGAGGGGGGGQPRPAPDSCWHACAASSTGQICKEPRCFLFEQLRCSNDCSVLLFDAGFGLCGVAWRFEGVTRVLMGEVGGWDVGTCVCPECCWHPSAWAGGAQVCDPDGCGGSSSWQALSPCTGYIGWRMRWTRSCGSTWQGGAAHLRLPQPEQLRPPSSA